MNPLADPYGYGPYFRKLHYCVIQTMNHALEEMELTGSQGHILGYLSARKDPPCSRDIEKAFRLSHATVSGLLSRLEEKGFIAFRPDEQDHRFKRIYILPKGEMCHEAIRRQIQATEQRLVEGFSPEEQEQFTAFLKRALTNMGVAPRNESIKGGIY